MRTPTEERIVHASAYTYKPDGTRNDRMEVYTSDYSLMAKFDKFRAKPKQGRPMTEEEKQVARERMMKMREAGVL